MDEVATDTATRGALKDDITFKSLRDVIKPTDDLKKIAIWNKKVEDAVGAVTSSSTSGKNSSHDTTLEAGSVDINSSSVSGMLKRRRGRSLLPGSSSSSSSNHHHHNAI